MNNELSKQYCGIIRAEALKLKDEVRHECVECLGDGREWIITPNGRMPSEGECSSCTPRYNDLLALTEARCWHEQDTRYSRPLCTICDKRAWRHHTPTIPSMVDDLNTLGVYEALILRYPMAIMDMFAGIPQTPEYFVRVVVSCFKGRE